MIPLLSISWSWIGHDMAFILFDTWVPDEGAQISAGSHNDHIHISKKLSNALDKVLCLTI